MSAEQRIEHARSALNAAKEAGYFEEFAQLPNEPKTHLALTAAANELLAGEFPEFEIKIVTFPGSYYVDMRVVERAGK